MFADSTVVQNPDKMGFVCGENWLHKDVSTLKIINLDDNTQFFFTPYVFLKNNFFKVGNRTFFVCTPQNASYYSDSVLQVDYVIFSHNPPVAVDELCSYIEMKQIIIAPNNTRWQKEKWKRECLEMGIDYYAVADSGAWILNLNN